MRTAKALSMLLHTCEIIDLYGRIVKHARALGQLRQFGQLLRCVVNAQPDSRCSARELGLLPLCRMAVDARWIGCVGARHPLVSDKITLSNSEARAGRYAALQVTWCDVFDTRSGGASLQRPGHDALARLVRHKPRRSRTLQFTSSTRLVFLQAFNQCCEFWSSISSVPLAVRWHRGWSSA